MLHAVRCMLHSPAHSRIASQHSIGFALRALLSHASAAGPTPAVRAHRSSSCTVVCCTARQQERTADRADKRCARHALLSYVKAAAVARLPCVLSGRRLDYRCLSDERRERKRRFSVRALYFFSASIFLTIMISLRVTAVEKSSHRSTLEAEPR